MKYRGRLKSFYFFNQKSASLSKGKANLMSLSLAASARAWRAGARVCSRYTSLRSKSPLSAAVTAPPSAWSLLGARSLSRLASPSSSPSLKRPSSSSLSSLSSSVCALAAFSVLPGRLLSSTARPLAPKTCSSAREMSSWTSCDAAGWHGDSASDDEEVIVLKPSSRLPDPVWPSSSLSSANGSVSSSNSMNGFINNPTRKASSSRSLSTSASGDVDALANSLENTRLGSAAVRPLIVLDLNGLVVRRVKKQQITQAQLAQLNRPGGPYPAGKLYYAWKRPFAEDFIKFLAAKFDVVIWSSARRDNINHMLRVVLTNSKRNSILSPKEQESILGIMDQSDCVVAAQWPDDPDRPLFIKELERVWKNFPQHGPQDTLLVDDSLYKAARNPANTAIHPKDWRIGDLTDKSLAPGGNMRGYLENLANAAQSPDFKGVPAFVAANPFDSGRTDEENKEELYFDEWVRKALDGSS